MAGQEVRAGCTAIDSSSHIHQPAIPSPISVYFRARVAPEGRTASSVLLLLVLVCCAMVDAGVLTPYEQTIGQWDVSLRCAGNEVPSMLFPSREHAATKE